MKSLYRSLILALALLLSACSMSGNITDMSLRNTSLSVGQLTGVVSGALVQTTSSGYQVQATVGDPYSAIMSTSTGGYTLYSSVSGNMASSAVSQNIQ